MRRIALLAVVLFSVACYRSKPVTVAVTVPVEVVKPAPQQPVAVRPQPPQQQPQPPAQAAQPADPSRDFRPSPSGKAVVATITVDDAIEDIIALKQNPTSKTLRGSRVRIIGRVSGIYADHPGPDSTLKVWIRGSAAVLEMPGATITTQQAQGLKMGQLVCMVGVLNNNVPWATGPDYGLKATTLNLQGDAELETTHPYGQ